MPDHRDVLCRSHTEIHATKSVLVRATQKTVLRNPCRAVRAHGGLFYAPGLLWGSSWFPLTCSLGALPPLQDLVHGVGRGPFFGVDFRSHFGGQRCRYFADMLALGSNLWPFQVDFVTRLGPFWHSLAIARIELPSGREHHFCHPRRLPEQTISYLFTVTRFG